MVLATLVTNDYFPESVRERWLAPIKLQKILQSTDLGSVMTSLSRKSSDIFYKVNKEAT